MAAPNNNDFDKNANPSPVPDNKVLHPLFGTYAATETFAIKSFKNGTQHQHFEAYLDDPVKKTWTVAKVVTTAQNGMSITRQKITTATHLVKAKVSFKEALEILGANEKDCKSKPQQYDALYPEAAAMGYLHYKAFAEREGYVYDTQGKPHARPNASVLPLGFTYTQEDVDSANSHVQRPDDEFDNSGTASKLPNSYFLLDKFTKAAHKNDYQTSMNGVRSLNLMDRFVDQIEQAQKSMEAYCENYAKMGQGGLIDDADAALTMAESSLRQLRAYGADTTEYDNFLLQCRTAAYVLHAEGLYDLMNKGKGDFNANEALFQSRVTQALETFKKIDSSESAHRTLENMIVQTSKPEVPDAIGAFVRKYRQERAGFSPPGPAPAGKPKPPGP